MKKTILLLTACLALGGFSVRAQEKAEKPQQKIRIFVQEEGQEPHVYEYNSLEEMQADERLKDKNIPLLKEGDIRLRITQGLEGEPVFLRRNADSARVWHAVPHSVEQDRVFFKRELGESKKLFFRDTVDGKPIDVFRTLDGLPLKGREITILDTTPLRMEELPADMQKLLQENGMELKEGEKVVIVRSMEHPPVPPMPPVPPVLPALPAEPALPVTPAEAAPVWLEALKVSPNPANGQVRVQFRSAVKGSATVRLLDMNGKQVFEETYPDAAKHIDKTIQLPAGSKGLHLLEIKQAGKSYTSRIYIK